MRAEEPPIGTAATLQGRLQRQPRDGGSKSERQALLLALDDGRQVLLRREGANPFRDPELEVLEGQVLRVQGEWREGYFLVRQHAVAGA